MPSGDRISAVAILCLTKEVNLPWQSVATVSNVSAQNLLLMYILCPKIMNAVLADHYSMLFDAEYMWASVPLMGFLNSNITE